MHEKRLRDMSAKIVAALQEALPVAPDTVAMPVAVAPFQLNHCTACPASRSKRPGAPQPCPSSSSRRTSSTSSVYATPSPTAGLGDVRDHAIRGIRRRISNVVCKKYDIDMNQRAGELMTDEVNKIVAVTRIPLQIKMPACMLNMQRDIKDGKTSQEVAKLLDQALRDYLDRMERVRLHRGLRHY